MKTNSVALRVLPEVFNVFRIIMIIGGVCALILATSKFFQSDYIELSSPLKITKQVITTGIRAKNADIKNITVSTTVPLLKALLKINFFIVVATYLYIISTSLALVIQFQNLRDFFNSIKIGEPFDPKNVYRLKIIAFTFLFIGIIHVIKQLIINILLTQEINNLHFSFLYWGIGFTSFIWAIVIFIIADVFKYGFTLKKENEEFV